MSTVGVPRCKTCPFFRMLEEEKRVVKRLTANVKNARRMLEKRGCPPICPVTLQDEEQSIIASLRARGVDIDDAVMKGMDFNQRRVYMAKQELAARETDNAVANHDEKLCAGL